MDNFSLPFAAELSESKQMKSKNALGVYGEELATRYLSKNGLVILERNWRSDHGEIDVIAREKSDLVISEVKTRRTVAYGDPIESVTPRKVRRMRGLALRWLDTQSVSPRHIRFDVVGILAPVVGPPTITHIRGI